MLWPPLFIIVSFVIVVTALVDFALVVTGARHHHYTLLVLTTMRLLAEVRGTQVNANHDDSHIRVDIY
ncbi:MAG: hypothetical protein ACYC77_10215 [Coriobacteriia bacterium]